MSSEEPTPTAAETEASLQAIEQMAREAQQHAADMKASRWAAFSDVELGDLAAGLHATHEAGNADSWPLLREAIADLERRRA